MDVRFWGPQVWSTMDFLAFNYPLEPSVQDKKNMKQFFTVTAQMLPCQTCREHFAQLLQDFPVEDHLQSREALTKWLVEAHNRVNERLGKPRVAYETVAQKYQQMRGTCEMGKLTPAVMACPARSSATTVWMILALLAAVSLGMVGWWWLKKSQSTRH